MLTADRAIVLQHIPHGETSVVAQLFCREKGRTGFYIPGARRPRAAVPVAYLMPLTVLEMEMYYKPTERLQKIRSARPAFPLLAMKTAPLKGLYGQLMAEVLFRTLPHGYFNPSLFDQLAAQIRLFEKYSGPAATFAVKWLVHYFQQLGLDPLHSELSKDAIVRMLSETPWGTLDRVRHDRTALHRTFRLLCRFYESSQNASLPLRTLRLISPS